MSGRNRVPGGEMRKASQRRARPTEVRAIRLEVPWQPGDRVRWGDRAGIYRREVDEENAEVGIGERVHRVRKPQLRAGHPS